jgi:D-serine deaminase-like pyridoxal phosphate-dependent protein
VTAPAAGPVTVAGRHDGSVPRTHAEPPTPSLVVDRDVLEGNIARMTEIAHARGLRLRPHVKTHKVVEIARMQLAAGAEGITVATVAEAEVFVAAGCADVFIAYPLWVDPARGARLRALAARASVQVGVDSVEAAVMLARNTAGPQGPPPVLVEVDSGHHRTGVEPGQAGQVAAGAARAGLEVRGVFTFPGHGYGPGMPARAAAEEARALEEAARSVRAAGLSVKVVSGGSTPTAELSDPAALTEIRPGVYVFGDAQQWELGRCGPAELALTVATTVVSRSGDRVVVDAGSKVLGADRPAWASGFGRVPDIPDARIVALSEHHATIRFPEGVPPPPLGTVLRVAPNHVCAAVNLADELIVAGDGPGVTWRVAARGANS